MVLFERHGTVNASPVGATEGVVLLAAVVETLLLAGLVIGIVGVGTGSATLDGFLRLYDIVLGPFTLIPLAGEEHSRAIGQQVSAVLGYGLFFLLLICGVSWLDRRRVFS